MGVNNNINKRKYFRIECSTPLCTEVTIVRINSQPVNTGTTKVCVEDISPGGLKFISKLDLPTNPDFIVKFYTVILDEPLLIEGYIVRKAELENGIYQYGVKFVLNVRETTKITNILSELGVRSRNGLTGTSSNLCIKSKMECFKLTKMDSEKRVYMRFECPSPLCAKVILKRINNKLINSYLDHACIEDIGQGGLRFLSQINYPVINDILYEFHMIVIDQKLFLRGYIIRKREIEKDIYEYGVRFNILDEQKEDVKQAIDAMKINMNRKIWFKKSSFCLKNKMDCLRTKNMDLLNL